LVQLLLLILTPNGWWNPRRGCVWPRSFRVWEPRCVAGSASRAWCVWNGCTRPPWCLRVVGNSPHPPCTGDVAGHQAMCLLTRAPHGSTTILKYGTHVTAKGNWKHRYINWVHQISPRSMSNSARGRRWWCWRSGVDSSTRLTRGCCRSPPTRQMSGRTPCDTVPW
jgi:hypothetical protein